MAACAIYRFFGILFIAFCFAFMFQKQAFSQSVPQRFSYQAVIRDGANQVLNKSVGIRLSILQGSESGTAVYAETYSDNTNANDLISLQMGGGAVVGSRISGLAPNTLYYVRAYATNGAGTAYDNQVSFTTAVSTNPTDADGNTYTTVTIGTQVWMKENLKVSKYRNGDPIGEVSDAGQWAAIWNNGTPTGRAAWCYYNNDAANNTTYGKLYNWYAVADPRGLCPTGWHVPSDAEWTILENFLGGASVAGGKMKSTGTIEAGTGLWYAPNQDATNSSGFTAFPGGYRYYGGTVAFGSNGAWWSSTEFSSTPSTYAWFRGVGRNGANSGRSHYGHKTSGYSVRCLRD
jgi:uncharacterized protein (TIGR02145 family)